MSTNGVSLTAGMRSNLVSLQNTVDLLNRTQTRLSTGKKVNSALDDPISFFTAREHMSRVSDLQTLKNGMSEGIQTITAANAGIDSIISLIEAAKATAESAKSAASGGSGDTISTLTLDGVTAGNTVSIGGSEFTASTVASASSFVVGATDEITAANLAALINATTETTTHIDATSVSGSQINLALTGGGDMAATNVTFVATTFTETLISASDALDELVSQYAELMTQLDGLQSDAGYKGINLLNNEDLTVQFEWTHSLTANGFDASVLGLGLSATADSSWASSTNIDSDIAKLETAVDTLQSKASSLASTLSIVTTRQDFTSSMIDTLTTGADNLTLADMNEEAANMLMLQTQQALGTSSLSLSAQTAQSVLKLF
ncbi:MAG: flagellin [Syntrophales bacterium]|nr:flagellin [Syntrophales bacterium]